MKKRTLFISFGSLILLIGLASIFFYIEIWIPAGYLRDVSWLNNTPAQEKIKIAHKVLRYPIGNHHDAFIILVHHGNEDSIPYLINALKWYERFNKEEDDFIACTKTHCLEALRKITGKDMGNNTIAWKNWYNGRGK